MSPSDSLFLRAYGLFFVGLGLLVLRWSLSAIVRSRRSRSWPSVLGRIISSEVRRAETPRLTTHWPDVRYEYKVNGTLYRSETIAFGQNGDGKLDMAGAVVAQYASGREVKVFYDPKSPKVSCLKTELMTNGIYIAVFVGMLCVSGGLFFALVSPLVFAAK